MANNFVGALGEDNVNDDEGVTIVGVTGNDIDNDGRRAMTLTMTIMVTAHQAMTTMMMVTTHLAAMAMTMVMAPWAMTMMMMRGDDIDDEWWGNGWWDGSANGSASVMDGGRSHAQELPLSIFFFRFLLVLNESSV